MFPKTDKKIAVFLADGCEEVEALATADMLSRAGISRTLVSINDTREIISSHKIPIMADICLKDICFDDYDMIVLPGGIPGTPNLEACKELMDQVVRFAAEGRSVAAICAAPSILAHLGLLKGRHAACNPVVNEELDKNGAIREDIPVVADGNIITARAVGVAIPFGLRIVEHYLGRDAAVAIRDSALFPADF